jgi:two-component system, chemotaxis family, chemotaxis protein CheY
MASEMSKRVLAVDDSKTMRDMISFALRGAGFEIEEAEDGEVALEKLAKARFDLIITDLNMPRLDGVGLIRNVRSSAQHQDVPIVILISECDSARGAGGKAAGATAWLIKPFSPDKLVELVQQVCA